MGIGIVSFTIMEELGGGTLGLNVGICNTSKGRFLYVVADRWISGADSELQI